MFTDKFKRLNEINKKIINKQIENINKLNTIKEYRVNTKDFTETATIKQIVDSLTRSEQKHNVAYGIENK